MPELPYCKVYLTGFDDPQSLRSLVAHVTDGVLSQRTVQTGRAGGLLVDVFTTGRHATPASGAGDFVHWPAYLEIEPVPGAATEADGVFVAEVTSLLKALQAQGLRTVASGDLETQIAQALAQSAD